jgi:predicted nuclease of restriction endonuclease-like RecB superfamily
MTLRYQNSEQRQKTSDSVKGKTGGFRNFGGNGKKGICAGYVFQSSWEEVWIKYHLKHEIPFRRCTEYFEYEFDGKKRKYYPDFFLPETNTYVEIKGFWSQKTEAKIGAIPKEFKTQVVMFKEIEDMRI